MQRAIRLGTIFATLVGLLVAMFATGVAAQSMPNSLTVSPLRTEISLQPGTAYDGQLTLKNGGTEPQKITLFAEAFNVVNASYDYLFESGTDEATWIRFDSSEIILEPEQNAAVGFRVSVPLKTEPGGYYLALFALREPVSSEGGISAAERVASLLYLTVAGDASRTGSLIQLNTPSVTFGPSSWSASIQNSGTVHFRSTYAVSVQNLLGQEFFKFEDSRLILPQSIRLIEASLPQPEIAGLYKATYTVSLGDEPAHQETRWFLYAPPLQLLLLALIIVGLVILLRKKRH